MTFVYIKKNFTEPFKVQIVAQNETAGTELVVDFSIKHINDWPEIVIEQTILMSDKFLKMDSLLKTQKKKMTEQQANDAFRINSQLNRLMGEHGLVEPEAKEVWKDLTPEDKAQITKAFLAWSKKESAKKAEK